MPKKIEKSEVCGALLTWGADSYCATDVESGGSSRITYRQFRDAMQRRAKSPALRTGTLKVTAVGNDVVVVHREIVRGKDVFDNPAKDESVGLAINRSAEMRWVENGGKMVEIPPESAVWL